MCSESVVKKCSSARTYKAGLTTAVVFKGLGLSGLVKTLDFLEGLLHNLYTGVYC